MNFGDILKILRDWRPIGRKVDGTECFERVPDWVQPRARGMGLPGLYFIQGRDYMYRIEVRDAHNQRIWWRRSIKIGLPGAKHFRRWHRIGSIANGREEVGGISWEIVKRVRNLVLPGLYFFHGSHFQYRIEVRDGRNALIWRRPNVRSLTMRATSGLRRSRWALVALGLAIVFISIAWYPTAFGDSRFARWMETPVEVLGGLLVLVGILFATHRTRLKIVRTLLILLVLFTASSYAYYRLDESGKIDEWLGRSTEEGTIGGEIAERIPTLVDTIRGLTLKTVEPTPAPTGLPRPSATPQSSEQGRVWIGNSYLVGGDGSPIMIANNANARNPSWSQLVDFLRRDSTDTQTYAYGSFVCADFAEMLHNNAEAAGWRAAYVTIGLSGSLSGHALNAFETSDRGLVYIDCTGLRGGILGPSNRDKVVDVAVGKDYVPDSIFPEAGWRSTWGSLGPVTRIKTVQW